MLWRYSYELFPKPINYLFRCVFQFWIGLTVAKSFPCICQFSHMSQWTPYSIVYIIQWKSFQMCFSVLICDMAKSYPCNCHFSLHVVKNTVREPCRTNIAVFFNFFQKGEGVQPMFKKRVANLLLPVNWNKKWLVKGRFVEISGYIWHRFHKALPYFVQI